MENFILYLGKASIILTIFFLAYYFLLRKETFFKANRWFLLLGIITSLALPFLVFTKIIWVEPLIEDFAVPINNASAVPIEKLEFEINWFYVFGGIYFAGIFFFFGKFTRDILSLLKIISHKKAKNQQHFKLIDTEKIQSPFSFFNFIIFNSKLFKEEELQNIIAHEKVHSSQYHSVDMLFGQLFCIAFWFNPFSWLHKKAIAQNLEFIADSEALKQVSDRINYQKTLLKVSAPQHCISITNHFYQSLIKKRIIMLNKNQSKVWSSWKYATVLPLITLFMLQFQVETLAQEKEKVSYEVSSVYYDDDSATKADGIMIMSITSDKEINDYIAKFTKDSAIKLESSGIKRDETGKIIEISFSYDDHNGTAGIQKFSNSGNPIFSILFQAKKDKNGKMSLKVTDTGVSDKIRIQKISPTGKDSIHFADYKETKNQKPVLMVVNGKVLGMSDKVDYPDSDNIKSVNVIKNKSAIEKYGEDGKNGVIEIFLINNGEVGNETNSKLEQDQWIRNHKVKSENSRFEKEESIKTLTEAISLKNKEDNNSKMFYKEAKVILANDANSQKKPKVVPKMFALKNGDEVLIFDEDKLKVPGHKTIIIEGEIFLINGRTANAKEVKSLEKISKIDIIYADKEKSIVKKVRIKTP